MRKTRSEIQREYRARLKAVDEQRFMLSLLACNVAKAIRFAADAGVDDAHRFCVGDDVEILKEIESHFYAQGQTMHWLRREERKENRR
jgi:hypothetical protein